MWNLVALEGFFEGPKKWDLDWHEYVWGDELEQLSLELGRTADALLLTLRETRTLKSRGVLLFWEPTRT